MAIDNDKIRITWRDGRRKPTVVHPLGSEIIKTAAEYPLYATDAAQATEAQYYLIFLACKRDKHVKGITFEAFIDMVSKTEVYLDEDDYRRIRDERKRETDIIKKIMDEEKDDNTPLSSE